MKNQIEWTEITDNLPAVDGMYLLMLELPDYSQFSNEGEFESHYPVILSEVIVDYDDEDNVTFNCDFEDSGGTWNDVVSWICISDYVDFS